MRSRVTVLVVVVALLVLGATTAVWAEDSLDVNLNQGVYVWLTNDYSERYISLVTGIGYAEDADYTRDDTVTGSFVGATGLITTQMSSGNANILHSDVAIDTDVVGGNALSISVTDNSLSSGEGSVSSDVAEYEADIAIEDGVKVRQLEASTYITENYDAYYARRDGIVGGSFAGSSGVITAQLSSGNANILTSNVEVSMGGGEAASIAVNGNSDLVIDVTVGTVVDSISLSTGIDFNGGEFAGAADGEGEELTYSRSDIIGGGSFDGASGIITAQLSSGDANILHSTVRVNAYTSSGIDVQVADNTNSEVLVVSDLELQEVMVGTYIYVTQEGSYQRSDIIDGSFNGASGIVTIQTSSGAANVVTSTVSIGYGVGQLPANGIGIGVGLPDIGSY